MYGWWKVESFWLLFFWDKIAQLFGRACLLVCNISGPPYDNDRVRYFCLFTYASM